MDKIKITLYYAYSHSVDIEQDDNTTIEARLHHLVLVVNGIKFYGECDYGNLMSVDDESSVYPVELVNTFRINGTEFGLFLNDEKEENLRIHIQNIVESHNHSDFELYDHDVEEIFDFELKKITLEEFERDYMDGLDNYNETPNIDMPQFDVEDLIQKYIGTSDSDEEPESDEE